MKLRLREARPVGGELQKNPDEIEENVWPRVEERLKAKQSSENQAKGV